MLFITGGSVPLISSSLITPGVPPPSLTKEKIPSSSSEATPTPLTNFDERKNSKVQAVRQLLQVTAVRQLQQL